MTEMKNSERNYETIKEATKRVLESHGKVKQLAEHLGIAAKTLYLYANVYDEEKADAVIPSRYIVPITKLANDPAILEYLCKSCGYIPVRLPQGRYNLGEHLKTMNNFVKQFSKALQTITEAMEDGIIEPREQKDIELHINHLIEIALTVKVLMEEEASKYAKK